MNRKYALDANILISCSRRVYTFEIAPGFWRQLKERGYDRVVLIDKVKDEIYRSEDKLSRWLGKYGHLFINNDSRDNNVINNYAEIITSIVNNKQYREAAKIEFANAADSWLCAHALTYDLIIVTEETYEPDSKKRIKIPNVCREFNIDYTNLLHFIEELGIRFE